MREGGGGKVEFNFEVATGGCLEVNRALSCHIADVSQPLLTSGCFWKPFTSAARVFMGKRHLATLLAVTNTT